MHLIIVSGFLGSGKTTLLLALARELARDGHTKVAVVENEVGEVGIDDVLVAEAGLPVREIYSGCICCSLRLDLVQTLLELEREHAPDVVLLEPSGVASPAKVLGSLVGYGGEIERRVVLNVVDASRFHRVRDLSIPIVRDGLEVADAIVVTKGDLVSAEAQASVRDRLGEARPDLPVQTVVAAAPAAVASLARHLLGTVCAVPNTKATHATDQPDGPVPAVCSHQRELAFASPPGAEAMGNLLGLLRGLLVRRGCTLVGHVKAVITSPGGGYLFGSLTDLDGPVQTRGRLPSGAARGQLTINAIVYGMEDAAVAAVVREAVDTWDLDTGDVVESG